MRAKKILVLVAAAAAVIGAISLMTPGPVTFHQTEQPRHEPVADQEARALPLPASTHMPSVEPPSEGLVLSPADRTPPQEINPAKSVNVTATPAPAQAKKPKEPLRDPEARVALGLVGIDPEAEAYWLEAIFDTALPPNEREDLMEDLNEDGLSDTKRPGPQDLPLILNRLAIIEEILPHADEFMVTHLAEAYRDLLNLADVTQGGGKPVR